MENYFLDPEYLSHSKYIQVTKETLSARILELAQNRLLLDACNLCIIQLREKLKENWINTLKECDLPANTTPDKALQTLLERREWQEKTMKTQEQLAPESIETRFWEILKSLTGGGDGDKPVQLEYSRGQWMDLLDAKKILNQVISQGKFFSVMDRQGKNLEGAVKMNEVFSQLIRDEPLAVPEDFRFLRERMSEAVKNSNRPGQVT